jgi:hypothetical protein
MLIFEKLFPGIKNNLKSYKVHLAVPVANSNPLDEFLLDKFKKWQEWQNKRNFQRTYIISLIQYSKDEWLFAGVYKSNGYDVVKEPFHYEYKTELLDINKDLIGRLIINFKKTYRQTYLCLENCIKDFTISQILKEKYSIIEFPGYENVKVDFEYLKTVIEKNDKSWYTALKNIKGVYLITDKTNGKHYVGKASGNQAFWSRWTEYVKNGHGGNFDLKKLIKKKGYDYTSNFQFSILEIRDTKTFDSEIIEREQFWKNVLLTKEYGYNKN